ncbi:putative Invariant surface glycoprotein [Trypanosoma vivax]|nr:putative Invariant surface glycoprotein [Trypanosoma vivax]
MLCAACCAFVWLLLCIGAPGDAVRIDLTRHSYPLSGSQTYGLNFSGAAALCQLYGLSREIPDVLSELAEKSDRWVTVAERLWTRAVVEWGRLQVLSVKVHGAGSLAGAAGRAESQVLEAVRVANSTLELARRSNAVISDAVAAAEDAARNAIEGDGSPYGGLQNILERHCGNERCKTNSVVRARCRNCVEGLRDMFKHSGILCGELVPRAVPHDASVSGMVEALARWDAVRPQFDEDCRYLSDDRCEPTAEFSCSVLEDWSPHFFSATRKAAEAAEALAGCASAVASAQVVVTAAVHRVDELHRMASDEHEARIRLRV